MDMIYVIGPGHGAPAALAALYLEGSLQRFYPDRYGIGKDGLRNLITGFSVPKGFPRYAKRFVPIVTDKSNRRIAISTLKLQAPFMKVASLAMLCLFRLVQSWTTPI